MKPPRSLTVGLFLLAQSQIVDLAAACVASPASLSAAATASRPNVIVIVADDLGYSDLGCYGSEILKPAGAEPVYRRLTDGNDGAQGGNDEADQAATETRKKKN